MSNDPSRPPGAPSSAEKTASILDVRRPSPTEIAGFFIGGTIGAYSFGPIGAIIGMIIGFLIASAFERYLDSTVSPHSTPHK